jgi:hypothetical protein
MATDDSGTEASGSLVDRLIDLNPESREEVEVSSGELMRKFRSALWRDPPSCSTRGARRSVARGNEESRYMATDYSGTEAAGSPVDRLIDLDPESREEVGGSPGEMMRKFRSALCRDLTVLLNTRRAAECGEG